MAAAAALGPTADSALAERGGAPFLKPSVPPPVHQAPQPAASNGGANNNGGTNNGGGAANGANSGGSGTGTKKRRRRGGRNRNKKTGTTDVMGRMRWEAPSLTIRTEFFKPEKGQYLHPQWDPRDADNRVNRPITHYEAAMLQDFPKDFLWCGTKIEIARQIGNAVPVGLARAIARHVRPWLQGAGEPLN